MGVNQKVILPDELVVISSVATFLTLPSDTCFLRDESPPRVIQITAFSQFRNYSVSGCGSSFRGIRRRGNVMGITGNHPTMGRMAQDFSRNPMLVYWEMTQACGLACKHCRAEAMPKAHPLELDTEVSKNS